MRILHSPTRVHGAIVVGGKHIADTLQCPHCNAHFKSIPGSGTKRGWCSKCHAVVCGREECMKKCVPFEKKMAMMEGKKFPSLSVLIGKK